MKKVRLLIIVMLMFIGIIFITGCGNKENKEMESKEPITVATQLSDLFKSEIKKSKDLEKIAQIIAESDIIIPEVQTFSIAKDDYLAGFKEDIKGFKKAIGIAPMISTIPMIAYVFEVENPESFSKTLEDNAQLNWNICVEADEMKITVVDNYIFFIMSPTSFE